MKKHLIYFLLILSSCNNLKDNLGDNPTITELEAFIHQTQDKRAVFYLYEYEELLKKLSDKKFIVLPLNEYKDSVNSSKVIVGLRHDVDCNPFTALKMAKIEKAYNFQSTYFLLSTADYYGKFESGKMNRFSCMEDIYKQIYKMGHEIGIHNDLLTIMIEYKINPFLFNKEELDFYRKIGIKITGTSAHGSTIAQKTVPSYQIFSDFAKNKFIEFEDEKYPIGEKTLSEFGYQYEAYHLSENKYFSECGGTWNVGSFNQLLNELERALPGEKIIILTHPVWWGKK